MSDLNRHAESGLTIAVEGGIALLTIMRPDRLNSIDGRLAVAIREAVLEIDADPAIRVGIITGTGERAFCVGADLKDTNGDAQHDEIGGWGGFTRLDRRTPFIAAVNGLAVGGGLEIALACDFIYAADSARFGFTEVAIGVVAGAGGMFRFARLVGLAAAKEHMLTGALFDAATAHRIGLVNELVPAEQLLARVRTVADRIAANAPRSIALTRSVIEQTWGADDATSWGVSDAASSLVLGSSDALEGTAAFIEKRPPVWTGEK